MWSLVQMSLSLVHVMLRKSLISLALQSQLERFYQFTSGFYVIFTAPLQKAVCVSSTAQSVQNLYGGKRRGNFQNV